MSSAANEIEAPAPLPKEDPEALVLRGRPPRAVRFRRGLMIGVAGALLVSLAILAWIALEPPGLRQAAASIDSDEPAARAPGDALADAPGSYGDVPRLGPPLPGDLGRPILEHRRSLGQSPAPPPFDDGAAAGAIEAERQRQAAQRLAARSSPVMVQLEGGARAPAPATAEAAPVDTSPAAPGPEPSRVPSAEQQHRIEFARSEEAEVGAGRVSAPASPWLLAAGTVIPASLVTGLNSDLPGMVLAQVTENVRDSATGRTVLIPQGARLIGSYDSMVAYGQRRALLVWKRIVFPDGSSLGLDNMPATDASGFAGVHDRVDSHTWQLLKGIALSTLLGVGTQLSLGSSESDLVRAVRESAQQNAAHAGDQITSRNLDVQPTLVVRPGWPVRALVNKDLVLQPWRG